MEDFFNDDFDKDYNAPDPMDDFEVGNFFRENLLKVRGSVSEKSFRKFAALESNGARVAFVLGLPAAHELPVEVENYERKDKLKSNMYKESGNTSFRFQHYPVAIDEYNQGVLVAPKEELGVILANRAASFYHMDQFTFALRDCEEALKVGYPQHLLHKLEERRARCLLALNSHTKAMHAFQSAIQALDHAKLPADKKAKAEADMRIMLAVMQKGQLLNQAQQGLSTEKLIKLENKRLKGKDNTPKIKACNPAYPSCSESVEFRDAGGEIGRYGVATKDIMPGEIVAVEKPFCSSLLSDKRRTHCHRCARKIGAPFPASCYTCSSIAYCSPECRDRDERLHKVECDLLGALWCSQASITCMLALRAILQIPYFDFVKMKDELKHSTKPQPSKAKPYLSSDYMVFRHLVTHEDERTAEDLFHRAYMAAWLLRVLKTSSYLPQNVKTPDAAEIALSEGELFIADAILHHLQLLQFNSHEISEFSKMPNKTDLSKGKNLFVAGGVYPTVALFNHSCNPGIVRYFVGNTMVVRAIRTITAGNEICDNYGPIFTEEEVSERRRRLRLQFWFDCNCEACKDHWPVLNDIDPNILRFKCETGPSCGNILSININTDMFMIPCSKCGNSTNLLKGLKAMQDTDTLYKTASKNLVAGNHEEALKAYLQILKILDETLALPIRDYHLCQQGVRQCMLPLGNIS